MITRRNIPGAEDGDCSLRQFAGHTPVGFIASCDRNVLADIRQLLCPLRPKVRELDVFREIKFCKRFHIANVSSCSDTNEANGSEMAHLRSQRPPPLIALRGASVQIDQMIPCGFRNKHGHHKLGAQLKGGEAQR